MPIQGGSHHVATLADDHNWPKKKRCIHPFIHRTDGTIYFGDVCGSFSVCAWR